MRTATLIVGMCIGLTLAGQALAGDKTYTLDFDTPLTKGLVLEETQTDKLKMKMKMFQGKKTLESKNESDSSAFEWVKTVVDVDGKFATEEILQFTKATKIVGGKTEKWGFHGQTVHVKLGADGELDITYANGAVPDAEDLEELEDLAETSDFKEDEKDVDGILAPTEPVAVGDSWKPDVMKLAMGMLELESTSDIDLKKSSAKMTLKKIKTKGDNEFAVIKGEFVFYLYRMGPIKTQKPIVTKIKVEGELSADGKSPEGFVKMKMTMKTDTPVTMAPGQVVQLTMNMEGHFQKNAKLPK